MTEPRDTVAPVGSAPTGRPRLSRAVGIALFVLATMPLAFNAFWVATHAQALRPVSRGNQAPLFEAPALDGSQVSLAELRGKVVLVAFWATWCKPCTKKMPFLDKLAAELGPQGLVVLAINVEGSREVVSAYVDRTGHGKRKKNQKVSGITMVVDDKGIASRYGVQTLPHTVVVGRSGEVVEVKVGPSGESELRATLKRALQTGGV